MESVDVLDSKSSAARRAGSSPATGTKTEQSSLCPVSFFYLFSFFRRIIHSPLFFTLGYATIRTYKQKKQVNIMGVIATLLLTTAIAGVAGTGVGGLIGALLQKDSNHY